MRIELPELPPYGETLIATTDMVYYPLDLVRRVTATVAHLEDVVRLIEAYDPTHQAVVLARLIGKAPIAITLEFPSSLTADHAAGVH